MNHFEKYYSVRSGRRLHHIISNNSSHLQQILGRLEPVDLAALLRERIITVDDLNRVCTSTDHTAKARIIYSNLQAASDANIQRFFSTLLTSKNLPPSVLEIVQALEKIALATLLMDQINPGTFKSPHAEDFPVNMSNLERILDEICKSIRALNSWQEVKYNLLEHATEIHEIEEMATRNCSCRSIIRRTLEIWLTRNQSRKTTYKSLVRILNESGLTREAESLEKIQRRLFALTSDD